MEKKVKILAALLGLQVLAALGLSWKASPFSSPAAGGQLLDFDSAAVDSIFIYGGEGESVELDKSNGGWQLPALDGFPADGQRIEQLLERLQQLETGSAIASSRDAQKRFKVSDDSYERKLVLKGGERELATLYLGTTPGMRRIHARSDSADAVYRVEFAASDLPLDHEGWQDNTVLQFPRDELTAIKVSGLQLERAKDGDDDVWHGEGLEEGELINSSAVDELARLIANLRIGKVLNDGTGPASLEEPALELEITRDGETVSYRLGQSDEDEQFVLKVSSRPEYFHLPRFRAEALLESSSREALLQVAADDVSASTSDDEEASADAS